VAASRHYTALFNSESYILILRPFKEVSEHNMQVVERQRKAHGVIGE
jgi:hypothetical protein